MEDVELDGVSEEGLTLGDCIGGVGRLGGGERTPTSGLFATGGLTGGFEANDGIGGAFDVDEFKDEVLLLFGTEKTGVGGEGFFFSLFSNWIKSALVSAFSVFTPDSMHNTINCFKVRFSKLSIFVFLFLFWLLKKVDFN